MTKETFNKAQDIIGGMVECQAKIDSYNKALINQTLKTAYSRDEIDVQLYNGEGKATTVFVPRKLVIDMLNSAISKYQDERDKLQAELDIL